MNKNTNYNYKINMIVCLFICIVIFFVKRNKEPNTVPYLADTAQIIPDTLDIYTVASELAAVGVVFPEIAACQAYLETGNFKSKLCINHNNLFGMMKAYSRDNMQFEFVSTKYGLFGKYPHWSTACLDYRLFQNQFDLSECTDYFQFLKKIRYAQDEQYISKLTQIYDLYFIRETP